MKLPKALRYKHFAIVIPNQKNEAFPVEMLTIDKCYTYSDKDSNLVSGPIGIMKHQIEEEPFWNKKLWNEYGWKLEEVEIDEIFLMRRDRVRSKPLGVKLDSALIYINYARVKPIKGRAYRFPLDMLRYDRAFPYYLEEVKSIKDLRNSAAEMTICKYSANKIKTWETARWDNFGYEIYPTETL